MAENVKWETAVNLDMLADPYIGVGDRCPRHKSYTIGCSDNLFLHAAQHNLFEIDFTAYEVVSLALRSYEREAIKSGSFPKASSCEDCLEGR
jgi:hypothetical protein